MRVIETYIGLIYEFEQFGIKVGVSNWNLLVELFQKIVDLAKGQACSNLQLSSGLVIVNGLQLLQIQQNKGLLNRVIDV